MRYMRNVVGRRKEKGGAGYHDFPASEDTRVPERIVQYRLLDRREDEPNVGRIRRLRQATPKSASNPSKS